MTIEGTHDKHTQQQKSHPEADRLCQVARQQMAKYEYPMAMASFQQAVKISATCINAYVGMAELFQLHGNRNNALQLLSHALKIEPKNSLVRRQMTPLIAELTPTSFSLELERDLTHCISEPSIDHQLLARVIGVHLSNKYLASTQLSSTNTTPELLQSLATDSLFLLYLIRCINTNPGIERWLTQIRKALLLATLLPKDHNYTELVCAFALQSFANEYVFVVSDAEEKQLTIIEGEIRSSSANTRFKLLLACMYRPLFDFADQHISLAQLPNTYLDLLIKRTLSDLQQEEQYRTSFSHIGEITSSKAENSISDKVRNQYEENPYPRWQIPPAPMQIPLTQILRQLPGVKQQNLPKDNISVLVAGCGTGFEPIELARMDSSAQITALDLSSKSLAYAKRTADELQISNIDFIQGNILDTAQLNKKFDLINSTGVLHHMENPQAGWQVLCGILKSGGVMRISLYSEIARRRVVIAHQRIKELALGDSNKDIKTFRAHVFSQPAGSPLAELAHSDDFYSLSGCRDLLFHVQEHRFTLLQLKTIIAELGLIAVGFDAPAWARQQFQQQHPNIKDALDLVKWHEFETTHPDTFVGMYALWLQKVE
ncbi:MAG: methyltransferase domain-containing protein [Cellvibrio sp.]|uniref:methyltransferase domain-containing protein n=1 Tax=Cellvibrio sp. TaxID=1965322 RepID=UPI0031A88091